MAPKGNKNGYGNRKKIAWNVNENGCYICTSHSIKNNAYPSIMISGIRKKISRLVYENNFGEIPYGMLVCHRCDTPSCINPEHLFLGTNADNTADKLNKNRQSRLKGEQNGNSKVDTDAIKKIRTSNDAAEALVGEYGIGKTQITRIRNGESWSHVKEFIMSKGERRKRIRNKLMKLTENQVIEIRKIKGLSQTEIAKIYGISQTTVSEIRLMKKWKHIKEEAACQ
jgi:predicted XRE-type DNA-binding protein